MWWVWPLLAVVLLLYVALILRPGSSFWIERALIRGGCVRENTWLSIPLYGALSFARLTEDAIFRVPKDDMEPPEFRNTLGTCFVILRSYRQCQEVWEKMHSLPKAVIAYAGLDILTGGPSIVTLNHAEWALRRKSYSKALRNTNRLQHIIDFECDLAISRLKSSATSVDVLDWAMELTFRVILHFTLGMSPETNQVHRLQRNLVKMLDVSWEAVKWPLLTVARMMLPWSSFSQSRNELKADLLQLVKQAKAIKTEGDEKNLIQMLVDEGLTEDELASEAAVILFAGHDTTSSGIATAVLYLLRQPKLIKHMSDAQYATAVFREAIRIAPPVATSSSRELSEPMTICADKDGKGGFTFPVGAILLPCIGPMHHSPSNFPDPLKFNPLRFLDKREDGQQGKVYSFSIGHRNCVGAPLALMEGPSVLQRLFSEFDVELASDANPRLTWVQTWKWEGVRINCKPKKR